MATKNLGTLAVYLTGNKTQLDRTLKSAAKGIDNFKGFALKATGALGLAFSFTAAIQGLNNLKNEMDKIGKAATNFGVATGFFQELEYAAQRTGTPIEQVQAGFAKIKKLAGDAAAGKGEAQGILQMLGLDENAVRNMSPEKLFNSVNSAIMGLDEKMRSSVGAKIYGEQFEKMNNFLRDYVALGEEAKDRGLIISDDEIKNAEALNDSILNLERSFRSLVANSGFTSWLARILEGVDELINRTTEKKAKKEAEKDGSVNRTQGVNEAIERAKSSGKFTEKELAEMAKYSTEYVNKDEKFLPLFDQVERSSAFFNIDKALKDAGYLRLMRDEKFRFGGVEQDSDNKYDAQAYRAYMADMRKKWGNAVEWMDIPKMTAKDMAKYNPRLQNLTKIKENAQEALKIAKTADEEIKAKLREAKNSKDVFTSQEITKSAEEIAQKARGKINALQQASDDIRRKNMIIGNRKEFWEATDILRDSSRRIGSAESENISQLDKILKARQEEMKEQNKAEEEWRKTEALRQKSIEQEQGNFEREIRYKYLELAGNGEQAQIERYINQLDDKYNSQFGRGLTDEEKSSFMAQKKLLMDLDRSSESLRTLFNGNALAETMQKGSLEVYRLQAKIKDPAREEQLKLARENADAAKRAAAAVEIMAQKTVGIQAANIGSVIGA